MIVRKPKFNPAVRANLDLLSLEQLRHHYLGATPASRKDIGAEIRWRIHREERRFWALAVMTFVAAVAGSVAAVFAVLGYYWPR